MTSRQRAFFGIIAFTGVTSTAWASGLSDLSRTELLPIHIAAMSISAVGILVGGYIARYLKKKYRGWLSLHKRIQWISTIVGAIGISTGVVMVQNTGGNHFRFVHSIVAVVSLACLIGAVAIAYGFLKGSKRAKTLRQVHRWTGRVAILAFFATAFLGLFAAAVL